MKIKKTLEAIACYLLIFIGVYAAAYIMGGAV